jgi:hypothetical protein
MALGDKNTPDVGKHGAGNVIKDGNTMPIDKYPLGEQLPPPFLNARADLPPLPDRYDMETFVREQAEFIKAQTRFLGVTNGAMAVANSTEQAAALSGYSLAQDRYIRALTRVLEQVRVL